MKNLLHLSVGAVAFLTVSSLCLASTPQEKAAAVAAAQAAWANSAPVSGGAQTAAPSSKSSAGDVGINVTSVTIGPVTTGLPCYNCDPGAGGSSIAIPLPLAQVFPSSSYQVTLQLHDWNFVGTCDVGYAIVLNGTVLASGSSYFAGGCMAGYVYYFPFYPNLGTATGNAMLVGQVDVGGVKKTLIEDILISSTN